MREAALPQRLLTDRESGVRLNDHHEHAVVGPALVTFAGCPEDGLALGDGVHRSVTAADPPRPLHDTEELPSARWMPSDDPAGSDPGDVGTEVRISGQPGCFDHVNADAAVLLDIALIKFKPLHA